MVYVHTLHVSQYFEYMNNHIYSTLFKTEERESDRRSKETEQRKESQKTKKQKTRTCDPKYQTTIYCINVKFPGSLNDLEKYFLGFAKILFLKNG